ncbi:serine/threonine protein kinase [Lacipirellula parvula]|uniref:Serine/threonine protein kinase n=1 Tax=Lacipirellula parvula TaxID=2650471 RepID=A0A5K7X4I6_9BACT|nr:serine/threonine-protein kinase [Lacipirellula parvula]BBO30687.1 serine/threonine protein kinase [Lacipirellula parvula]
MGIGGFFKSLMEGGKVDVTRRYEVLREAVSGTMSSFQAVRDRNTGEIVGLKVLDKDKTEQLEQRFRGLNKPSEGEIAMQFNHPRIVRTLSHGMTNKGEQYVVMEYLDGPGLNSLIIGRSKLLDGNRVALMTQAGEALQTVHEAGYIHRDICPRNFVCTKDATSLKLIDFGLTVPAKKEFQQPGIRTGTPNYMAPEVVRRKPTDHRLDIFAFGVSMYEMFSFELPWQRGSGDGLAAMGNGQSAPVPLEKHCPKINPVIRDAIHKCLEPEAEKRFGSMKTLLNAIRSAKTETV